MKKIASFVLAAAMLVLCAASAFATEVNWDTFEEQAAETVAKGEFVTFDEISVKMWVPSILPAVELTDEDQEQGYIAYFMTEDEAAAISVMYVDVDGMELEEYKAKLEEAGATDIEDVVINGLPAVSYTLEESDTACVAFTTEAGYILEVAAAPVSDENFAGVITMVMASIQEA